MKVAIIPARGGSVRIPRKNIRDFFGKPIIAYSIDCARRSRLFDLVYVSTEDAEIKEVARRYGAGVIDRPSELAEVAGAPDLGTQEVTRHGILALRAKGVSPDYVCCIYPTAPLMIEDDLKGGFHALTGTPPYDFVFPVGYDNSPRPRPMDAGQWYWGSARAFLERRKLTMIGNTCLTWALPKDRVCDINTLEDWARAEIAYESLFIKQRQVAYLPQSIIEE